MNKLPRITGKEAVSALKKAGFVEIRMRGSHCKILAPKTLKSILKPSRHKY